MAWRVRWVLRDLMDCQDLRVSESQDSKVSVDRPASKVRDRVRLSAWCDA